MNPRTTAIQASDRICWPILTHAPIPQAQMTPVLRYICGWTPLGAAVQALQRSLLVGFPSAKSLLVMVAYAAIFGYLADRHFRWE